MNDLREPIDICHSHPTPLHNFGFLTKVKYGGALGKITAVAAAFFITLCFLTIAAWHNPYLVGGLGLIAMSSLVFLVLQMKAVFLMNPKMATLEGTEVIRYLEIELKSSQHAAITASGALLPPADWKEALQVSKEDFAKERTDD